MKPTRRFLGLVLSAAVIMIAPVVAALLVVTPGLPNTRFVTGSASDQILYTVPDGHLKIKATPSSTLFDDSPTPVLKPFDPTQPRSLNISIFLNPDGTVQGGDAGHDLELRGKIEDADGNVYDSSIGGPLLTGEIEQFGFFDAGGTLPDLFDFRFTVTGGQLASFYQNSLIAVQVTSDNGNTFAGVFDAPFTGNVKGNLGPEDFGFNDPKIQLVKKTNGTDNNTPPGVFVPVGSTVTWTYEVTNIGDVELHDVVVTDDRGVVVTCPKSVLAVGELMICTGSGIAQAGQYANVGDVNGYPPFGPPVSDTDPDHYYATTPKISLVKLTNGTDNNNPTGPIVLEGSTVTWSYGVTNVGDEPLTNVTLIDDNGTVDTLDDFSPTYVSGDDGNTLLDPGEMWTYTASGIAQDGQYENYANVNAIGNATGIPVTAQDLDHYFAYAPVSIGDYVWHDTNGNGLQEGSESGINSVALTLNGTDIFGAVVAQSTTTIGNGGYLFSGLRPGTYTVTVDASNFVSGGALAGFNASPTGVGGDPAADSNANPTGTTPSELPSGSSDLTLDFGYYKLTSLGDFVWHDTNADGDQDAGEPGIVGVQVTLLTCGGAVVATQNTGAGGLYLFTGLTPGCYKVQFATPGGSSLSPSDVGGDATDSDSVAGVTGNYTLVSGESNLTVDAGFYQPASIGDFVWKDVNANGIQDAGEPGIVGVPVTLLTCGGAIVATQNTGAGGLYLFTGLTPGCYKVQFGTPAGYVASPANVGGDATDSDSVAGVTGNYTLNSGDSNLTVDAGFYQLASLGDFVWKDLDADGIQDAGEPGIVGVPVTLLTCAGVSVATQNTGAGGLYLFTGLTPACYKVQFGTPAGYSLSPSNVGGDATDSDSVAGVTGNYTLVSGESNLTVDAGFYIQAPPPCVPLTFNFGGGNSATSGTAGNIRTFAAGGVSVKASAFSETKPGAVFNTAYLGHYGAGLGVTDGSENGSSNTHVTDNIVRNNYILFEFSQSVIIDKAFLEYIVGDSDMSVWIGNIANAYTNHQTLSAALLSGLAFTETNLGGSSGRTAELNSLNVSGNILVVAAKKDETNDGFKLKNVATLCPTTVCTAGGEFNFTGNSSASGTAGNIRMFSASGVNVKASAFSRTDSSGAWLTAYLGAYSGGLGVTDTGEGNGGNNTHKVDNLGGRNNYVLFEFDKTVAINRAFLDIVGADSDISIWIGTKTNPYTNHLTLSDALLASLTKEDNSTPNVTAGSRWADFNANKLTGNVLVISSLVGDQTPEDAFKLLKLAIACK